MLANLYGLASPPQGPSLYAVSVLELAWTDEGGLHKEYGVSGLLIGKLMQTPVHYYDVQTLIAKQGGIKEPSRKERKLSEGFLRLIFSCR
jgi:hypothetical protein